MQNSDSQLKAVYIGTLVHTPTLGELEILTDSLVTVDASGRVVHVATCASELGQRILSQLPSTTARTVLPKGSFLIPTFVDLHIHAPQYMYLGTGLHLPLMQWLIEFAYKAEQSLDADHSLAKRVYSTLADRLVRAGTGCVLAFGTIKEATNMVLASCLNDRGLRGFVGKLSMDSSAVPSYVESSHQVALSAAESFVRRCRETFHDGPDSPSLITPVITPRFVPTCSDELLRGLKTLAQTENVHIQSHLAESRDEVDLVRSTRGMDDIDVWEGTGMLALQNKVVQAHCTYLDPQDLERMHNLGVGIAHCPLSNAYFSAKPFRLREALDQGLHVGLGTDVAGGYSLDMMNSMRSAVVVSKMRQGARVEELLASGMDAVTPTNLAISWKESLYLATRGGAQALGLAAGQFCAGQYFDAQLIEIVDSDGKGVGSLDFFDDEPSIDEQAIEKWWCVGDERNRKRVWVQGRSVM